jgi:hypothetical protein
LRSNQLAQQEEKYRTKSGECYLAAHNALTPFEKQAWLELGRDWDKLADEVRDLIDAPPIVQLDSEPQLDKIVRVFQPSEDAGR